jgi:hypothetical protein
MDLINVLVHKRNTTVTVNGHTYPIDGDGVVRGVQQPDATKLLQNTEAWRQFNGKAPKGPAAAPQGKIALLGQDGLPIAVPPPPPPPPAVSPDQYVVPEDGDWPDPTEEMPMEYLREMAAAYQVKYNGLTAKKTLIKKIMIEMYPQR